MEKRDTLLANPSWLEVNERKSYADYVKNSGTEMNCAIRKATSTGRPFGTESFIDEIEFLVNRSLRPQKAGRPRRK